MNLKRDLPRLEYNEGYMDNITFENFKYAVVGFGVNVAVVGVLACYIFRGVINRISKLEVDVSELREKQSETTVAIRTAESICDERHR